jgi:6,7-dimethyl-8-ribityllumazine synthase
LPVGLNYPTSEGRTNVSGHGAPELTIDNAAGLRVAVVAAQWHEQVMNGLLDGAHRALKELGIAEPTVIRVPGTFELPVAAKRLAERGYDAVIALGVVIRGGTPHFEYVCDSVTAGLTRVALDARTPVGNGVLTCDTLESARDRCGLPGSHEDKGWEAVVAALEVALLLRSIRARQEPISSNA